jgi:acyl carrier protein
MNQELSSELSQIITAEILKQPSRKITAETKLITSGLIDSFHLVDLALMIEDRYGVHIDDFELNKDTFDTLAELEALIRQRQV